MTGAVAGKSGKPGARWTQCVCTEQIETTMQTLTFFGGVALSRNGHKNDQTWQWLCKGGGGALFSPTSPACSIFGPFFPFFNCEANRCSTSPATPPFPISKSSTSNWHWRVCLTSLRSVSFHSRLLLLPLYPFECNERRGIRTGKKKSEANKGRQMTGTNYTQSIQTLLSR